MNNRNQEYSGVGALKTAPIQLRTVAQYHEWSLKTQLGAAFIVKL